MASSLRHLVSLLIVSGQIWSFVLSTAGGLWGLFLLVSRLKPVKANFWPMLAVRVCWPILVDSSHFTTDGSWSGGDFKTSVWLIGTYWCLIGWWWSLVAMDGPIRSLIIMGCPSDYWRPWLIVCVTGRQFPLMAVNGQCFPLMSMDAFLCAWMAMIGHLQPCPVLVAQSDSVVSDSVHATFLVCRTWFCAACLHSLSTGCNQELVASLSGMDFSKWCISKTYT